MSGSDRPIWFAGDLGDPEAWAIASALPSTSTRLIDCPGDLPLRWPAVGDASPRVVVVHRGVLGATDGERLARLRGRLGGSRRIILGVGPEARYADIDRWSRWVDVVLPEAVAAGTIVRHVQIAEPILIGPLPQGSSQFRRAVAVASTNSELRATLAAILRASGYEVVERVRPEDSGGVATVWDVPVLEPGWRDRLATVAATHPVLALIGFLDRSTANLARAAGASACLDLPCDLADLVLAVDRIVGIRRDLGHPCPPSPNRGTIKAVGKPGG